MAAPLGTFAIACAGRARGRMSRGAGTRTVTRGEVRLQRVTGSTARRAKANHQGSGVSGTGERPLREVRATLPVHGHPCAETDGE